MTTIYDVMAALEKQVRTAVAGALGVAPIKSAVGWPPVTALQNLARNGGALISVYDRKVGRNTTRWSPYPYNLVLKPATLTTIVNAPQALPPATSGSLTLGGTVSDGDAVSLIATAPQVGKPNKTAATVVSGLHTDTPTSMATRLAAAINAEATLSTWLLATTAGPVVHLNNLTGGPVALQSRAGNGGTQSRELGRRESQMQIVVWTKTQPDRAKVVAPITALLGQLQVNFGITLADSVTMARLTMENDYPIEDDTLEDVYRHDFLTRLDYPVTTQDVLYAVLAPVPAYEVES